MEKSLEANVDPSLILQWIKKIGTEPSATVPLLQEIQSTYGYLPQKAMDLVVENSQITGSQLYGVATFYSQFRLKPVGRHLIKICHGTACHVRGADKLNTAITNDLKIPKGQDTTNNGAYTLNDVACVGCCSLAPVMVIDNEVYGELTGASASKTLSRHAKNSNETIK
ncbi:MAG TPA: NADH-quinone oxidoreductase subunit NuoE [Bacteriovoracaceae bacterium]|nr:NADH-quinone oxidoreductase subunit NuoE [Bacteriovoracaceae bacterium]